MNMIKEHQLNQKPSSSTTERRMNKLNLFVTVRILLQILLKENPRLRMVAQKVLKDSYKLHQRYPEGISLATLIETGLRELVGEKYWIKANAIQRRECSVSVKSVCKRKNQYVFTVNTSGKKIDLNLRIEPKWV